MEHNHFMGPKARGGNAQRTAVAVLLGLPLREVSLDLEWQRRCFKGKKDTPHTTDPPAWVTDDEVEKILPLSWAEMTPRQRALYPSGLSQREKGLLWGDEPEGDDHAV